MQLDDQIQIDQPKATKKKIFLYGILVLAVIIGSLGIFYRVKIDSALSKNYFPVDFTIKPGESVRAVSSGLYDQGFISSAWVFDLYLRLSGLAGKIQAGTYAISPSESIREIAMQLATGRAKILGTAVQFKEGWTLSDIEAYLSENNNIPKTKFDAAQRRIAASGMFGEDLPDGSLEGYIFPDTYIVANDADSEAIIKKALDNLDAKLTPQMRRDIAAEHKTIYQILTMASIVEREVGRHTAKITAADLVQLETERKLIAGIFYKRLELGVPLQSDATVDYITKRTEPNSTAIDYQINSPYNTYKFRGLPPGPISNPSLSSIEAAIYPQASDYLYFLNAPDGTAIFAKTLDEQSRNKLKYLK